MVEKLQHQLTGYAEFTVCGDSARFLNGAAKSGYGFWNFQRREGAASVCCRARDYRRLCPLARRYGVRLRCRKKGGFPFAIRRLWLRKGLVAGIVLGAALYAVLSGFVWQVSVSGTEAYGDAPVLAAARKAGVYPGAPRKDLDPKLAGRQLIRDLDGLKWAAVNTDGCFAEIVIGEAAEAPEVADDRELSNMVASRAGTVLSVEAARGRPEVSRGDAVEKGDLLISGLYQEQLDPWDVRADRPHKTAGAARGRVIAETLREFTVQASAVKKEAVLTGQRQVRRRLRIFGLCIPLGLWTEPEGEYRLSRRDSTVSALGIELPLALEREVLEFAEVRRRSLSREELEQAALLKLRELQRNLLPEDGEVLREELSYAFPDGMCILTARCRCREEIGEVREILVK